MKNEICYIIIIHYNSSTDTYNCINSILDSSYPQYKIIVINNHNNTSSIKFLKNKLSNNKKIIFLNSGKNGGYAFGLNVGIRYAISKIDCKYIWLLNNDTLVFKDTLYEFMISDNSVKSMTIWGGKILNENKTIQSLGCRINKYFMSTKHNYKNFIDDNKKFLIKRIDYIHGCSMFFNKNIIDEIGLFNEDYFLFYEDVDYSFKARMNNIQLQISQNSKIIHKEKSSIKKMHMEYLSTVNRITFGKKYYNNHLSFIYLGLIYEFLKNLILLRIRRNIRILKYLYI